MAFSENAPSASVYLITFTTEVEDITHYAAAYYVAAKNLSVRARISDGKAKGQTEEIRQQKLLSLIPDAQQVEYLTLINEIKTRSVKLCLKYGALSGKIREFETNRKKIESLRDTICECGFPQESDVHAFVSEIHRSMVNGVVLDLIATSKDLYNQMMMGGEAHG